MTLLRTPDGIPEGWFVTVEDGVPVLRKRESEERAAAIVRLGYDAEDYPE